MAVELVSDSSRASLAKAIREESCGLCEAYFRWCERILKVWRGSGPSIELLGGHVEAGRSLVYGR